jgi:hypothetical protein
VRFLLDEDTPFESLRLFLEAKGLEVSRSVDYVGVGAKDPQVAAAARELGAVLVTWNRRDCQRIRQRSPLGHKRRPFDDLHLLIFDCPHVDGRARLEPAWPYIEFEWQHAQAQGRRFIVEIGDSRVVIW